MNKEPDYTAIGCTVLLEWLDCALAFLLIVVLSPFLLVIAAVYYPIRWLATWLGKRHVRKHTTAASALSDN